MTKIGRVYSVSCSSALRFAFFICLFSLKFLAIDVAGCLPVFKCTLIFLCILSHIVLQSMLAEPDLRHVVNTDATEAMQNYPSLYQQLVLRCVTASRELYGMPTAV